MFIMRFYLLCTSILFFFKILLYKFIHLFSMHLYCTVFYFKIRFWEIHILEIIMQHWCLSVKKINRIFLNCFLLCLWSWMNSKLIFYLNLGYFFFLLEIYLIDLRIWNIFLILLTSPFVNMLIVICQYHVLVLV